MVKKSKSASKRTGRKRAPKQSIVKQAGNQDKAVATHRSNETIAKTRAKGRGKPPKKYAEAEKAYRKYGNGILDKLGRYGVVGLSFGSRFKNGKPTGEPTIRLHVATEEDKRALKKNAKKIGFKKTYGGVETDIVVWNFKTSSAGGTSTGGGQSDGTFIKVETRTGTLGTTLVLTAAGEKRWLTAAHVAWREFIPPASSVAVTLENGQRIGTVSSDEHFRDQFVDVAFIKPEPPLPPKTSARRFARVTDKDQDATFTIKGALAKNATGKIVDPDYGGMIQSPAGPEDLVDHFLIQVDDPTKFLKGGDSGAIVFKGKILVGVVRAATDSGIAVVAQLDNLAEHALEFTL